MDHLKKSFMDLGLSAPVLRAVDDLGFATTTPIQAAAIPVAMSGRDILGQAQTGTGKTAAFGIPIIERVDVERNEIQAVVLTPTRELAMQVARDVAALAKHQHVKVGAIYGGQPIQKQIQLIAAGLHIVIGTPGRVIDHLRRRTVDFSSVQVAVLDEADEMLDMGFIDDIRTILRSIPRSRQTLLFSATMPTPILRLAERYMVDPEKINLSEFNLLVENTEHRYYEVDKVDAYEALADLVDFEGINRGLVFCNTRRETDELAARLKSGGYSALALHADMSQSERTSAMARFREGKVSLLVATDVAARGIDVFDLSHVINFHIPLSPEVYLHRIGRTGRAGRKGVAVTFIRGGEFHDLHRVQEGIDVWIEPNLLPDPQDVDEVRRARRIEEQIATTSQADVDLFSAEAGYLLDRFGPEKMAAALLKIAWASSSFDDKKVEPPPDYPDTGAADGMVRLVLGIGRKQIRVPDISRSIAGYTGMPRGDVGHIRLGDQESTVEVPVAHAPSVLENLDGGFIRGLKIGVRLAKAGETVGRGRPRDGRRPDSSRSRRGRRDERTEESSRARPAADSAPAPAQVKEEASPESGAEVPSGGEKARPRRARRSRKKPAEGSERLSGKDSGATDGGETGKGVDVAVEGVAGEEKPRRRRRRKPAPEGTVKPSGDTAAPE